MHSLAMYVLSLYVTLLSVSPTSGLVSVDGRSDTGRENYNTLCTVTVYYVHIHVYTYILPVNVRTYAYTCMPQLYLTHAQYVHVY